MEEFCDEWERVFTEAIELTPNGPNVAINVPAGHRHTVSAVERGVVLLEMKK